MPGLFGGLSVNNGGWAGEARQMKAVRVKLRNDGDRSIRIDDQPIPPGGISEWGINENSDGQTVSIVGFKERVDRKRYCCRCRTEHTISGNRGDTRFGLGPDQLWLCPNCKTDVPGSDDMFDFNGYWKKGLNLPRKGFLPPLEDD